MPATVAGIHLGPDTHANRPAANAAGLPVGSLYVCSDHNIIYQTDGSAWSNWWVGGAFSGDASDVPITDAGGYFTGTDVEAALQELGAGGGGGGVTREYLGHTGAVGATTETGVANRHYLKKITPANDCDVLSLQVHVKGDGSSLVTGVAGMLYEDNAGDPRTLLAVSIWHDTSLIFQNSAIGQDRWLALPLNYALTASTSYWIGVFAHDADIRFTKTTSTGSDRYFTEAGNWIAEAGRNGAVTTTTDDYDIRVRVIR